MSDQSTRIAIVNPTGDCGVPASPTNGTVAYTTTTEGSLATFQCSAGFVPGEVMTAVCENSGGVVRWSPNPGDLSCVVSTTSQGMQNKTFLLSAMKSSTLHSWRELLFLCSVINKLMHVSW